MSSAIVDEPSAVNLSFVDLLSTETLASNINYCVKITLVPKSQCKNSRSTVFTDMDALVLISDKRILSASPSDNSLLGKDGKTVPSLLLMMIWNLGQGAAASGILLIEGNVVAMVVMVCPGKGNMNS